MPPAHGDLPQLRLIVPIPPSTNNLYTNAATGRSYGRTRVKGEKYKAWLNDAGWIIRATRPPTFTRPVRVLVEIDLSRRRDVDNALKPLLDLLVYVGVLKDDSLVDDLRIIRRGSPTAAAISIWYL